MTDKDRVLDEAVEQVLAARELWRRMQPFVDAGWTQVSDACINTVAGVGIAAFPGENHGFALRVGGQGTPLPISCVEAANEFCKDLEERVKRALDEEGE